MKPAKEVQRLSAELRELRREYDELLNNYSLSEKQILALKEELDIDITPNHFRKTLFRLKEETERLRSIYPVEDLLAAKESEVEKTGKALASVTETHPEFESFSFRLKIYTQERDELRKIVSQAEEKFRRQILRIRTAGLMVPFDVHLEIAHHDGLPDSLTDSLKEDLKNNLDEVESNGNLLVPLVPSL